MNKYEEMERQAIEMIYEDDNLFCDLVDELDSWNGFADGYKCYPMYEIDELFDGVSISDFLDKLCGDFCHRDEYFVDTIYGISSTDDRADVYRAHTSAEEIFDNLKDNYYQLNIRWASGELDDLMKDILNYSEEDEEDD